MTRNRQDVQPDNKVRNTILLVVVVVTAPLWIPFIAFMVVLVVGGRVLSAVVLYLVVWTFWLGLSPRRVLFVYSDSPRWKPYIESRILPRLPDNTVVLNWSQRRQWPRFSLSVLLFKRFAGVSAFNPVGLVFERWRGVEDYRFWQAFRDAKHGHSGTLEFVEAQFLKHATR